MKKNALLLLALIVSVSIMAQDKWDLRKCVEYAMKNNISVKQADVQARIAALQAKQAKFNQYPTASFSSNLGLQYGRSIDPTSNQFTTTQLFYNQFQLQGGAQIYNFGRLKNLRQSLELSAKAAFFDVDKAANDVALNVSLYYLQILAANEQIHIVEVQIGQSKAQYDNTKRRVEAGALPELNLVQLEAQLATDSTNLITAKSTYEQNIISLKALLNIDMASSFAVDTPSIDKIPLEPLAELQPEYVYNLAKNTYPDQKAAEMRVKAAEKNILASKAAMYPSLTGFYSLGSTYNNQAQQVIDTGFSSVPAQYFGDVVVGGVPYKVTSLPYNSPYPIFGKTKYFKQLDNNFSQSVGIGINIPIFNNGVARIGYQRSKLDLRNSQLQQELANQTLKTNIYNAYNNAISSFQKYIGSLKSVASAQKAYDFAAKRYEVGLLSTIDLLVTQNTLLTAKLTQLSNQYDYVFKMKVLEFYKGQGVKLD